MCRVPRGELLQRRGVYLADAVSPGILLGHPWGGPDVQGVPQGHVPGEPWRDVVLLVVSGCGWRYACGGERTCADLGWTGIAVVARASITWVVPQIYQCGF